MMLTLWQSGTSKVRYTCGMKQRVFVRNVDAREYLDLFVVAAAASIILLRLYLHLTGYPTIGGSTYHIAHVLWGGALMLSAFVLNFTFLGRRVQRIVALLGGIGFGIFIDEVGKFITRDNNYFFRPAVGIMYAIFVVLYVVITYITRTQKLTSQEYQLNALRQLEEAVRHDMDAHEQAAMQRLLEHANQADPMTQQLQALLDNAPPLVPLGKPGYVARARIRLGVWYERISRDRHSHAIVRWFFVLETVLFLAAVSASIYTNFDTVQDFFRGTSNYGRSLVIGQLFATVAAAVCVLIGLRHLASSRLRAFEWFRTATLINLLLTEFFIFSRIQFGAIPGFVFNLVLFSLLSAVLTYEHRTPVLNLRQK